MLSSSVYFTVAISLALLVNPIRGQVFNDLEIAIQSFPGYADLPVCGVAVLAGRPGCVCFGETDVVHFVSCETAACICGIQKEAAITRIRNRGAFVCGTTDLATPPAAIALLESFCAAQAVTSTPSTPTPAPATSEVPSQTASTPIPPVPPTSSSSRAGSNTPIPSAQPLPGSPDELRQLLKCQPCGSSQCSFKVNSSIADASFALAVGQPVANCGPGSTTSTTSKIGGSITIGETWSVGGNVGLNLGVLQIAASGGYSKAEMKTYSQEITIEVMPGQMGVLVANVLFKRRQGSMTVGSSQVYPLISNQALNLVSYSPEIVACGSQFSANSSSSFSCDASTASKGSARPRGSLAGMAVVVFAGLVALLV